MEEESKPVRDAGVQPHQVEHLPEMLGDADDIDAEGRSITDLHKMLQKFLTSNSMSESALTRCRSFFFTKFRKISSMLPLVIGILS